MMQKRINRTLIMEDEEIIDDEAFKILIRSYIPDCIFDESYESPHVIFAYNNGVKDKNGFFDYDKCIFEIEKYHNIIVPHIPEQRYTEFYTLKEVSEYLKKLKEKHII